MRKLRFPLHGMIELTRRCNLRCPYCYVGFAHNISPQEELGREQIFSLLDQIISEGCLFVTFTGGEPLLRKDFRDIYSRAVRKGLLVSIFTNGTLIDRDMVDFFNEYPPFYIDITLPGVTAATYERVTGVKGSFSKCMDAVRLLKENEIPFRLKSVISRLNRHEIRDIKKFAEDMVGLFRFDAMISPRLDGSRDALRYRLTPEEIVALDYEDEKKWEDWLDFSCRHWGSIDSDRLYKCGAGMYSFHVSSGGKLGLCVLDTNYRYNLTEGSFKEGWHRFIPRVRGKKARELTRCDSCELHPVCGTCPAWSTLENGGPEKPVEFLCRVARVRGELLSRERRSENEEKEKVSKT